MTYVLVYYDKYEGETGFEFFEHIPDPVKWVLDYFNAGTGYEDRQIYEWDESLADWVNRQGDGLSDCISHWGNGPSDSIYGWSIDIPADGASVNGLVGSLRKCPKQIKWVEEKKPKISWMRRRK